MKKSITGFILGAVLAVLGVYYFPEVMPVTQRNINNETLNASLWMQTSAEYRALCYQGYNSALDLLRSAKESAKSGDKPLAVILDCDETLVDNLPADAAIIDNDAKSWNILVEWRKEAKAAAMPGAVEFLRKVDAMGVELFYVTNRVEDIREETMQNLKSLTFPQVDDRHVSFASGISNKDSRFRMIEQDYNVIVYLGDTIHDFPINLHGKMMQERNAITDQNRTLFGRKYIVFPNPVYGPWLGAFAEGYKKMSPTEQRKAKVDALRIWRK